MVKNSMRFTFTTDCNLTFFKNQKKINQSIINIKIRTRGKLFIGFLYLKSELRTH